MDKDKETRENVGDPKRSSFPEKAMYHLQQIIMVGSDPVSISTSQPSEDYLEQMVPFIDGILQEHKADTAVSHLESFAEEKNKELERLCSGNHEEYIKAVQTIASVKERTDHMKKVILNLNSQLQSAGQEVTAKKKTLLDLKSTKMNISESQKTLQGCLKVLNLMNRIHQLSLSKRHFEALKAIDELENIYLKEVSQYKFSKKIHDALPGMQENVKMNVMADVKSWLLQIRELSSKVGRTAFDCTEKRRVAWKSRMSSSPELSGFKLNSAIELVLSENEEANTISSVDNLIDFTPLYEGIHIYRTLGLEAEFKKAYENDRRTQKDLLLPSSLSFTNDDIGNLVELLENVAGFAIIEKITVRSAPDFRSSADVEDLWDSMCQKISAVILPALNNLTNEGSLQHIRSAMGLFAQTVETYDYNGDWLDSFFLHLFKSYLTVLRRQFESEFKKTVQEDDYMPMVVGDQHLWDKVIEVSWYQPDESEINKKFPRVLPFSEVYPLCCASIRNFMAQASDFLDDFTEGDRTAINNNLKDAIDEILINVVCKTLKERLRTTTREQIVQILINLEYFEKASVELQKTLSGLRFSQYNAESQLKATSAFDEARKVAETRIFELVNSKIDDFLEIAEYDWTTNTKQDAPSSYLTDMVQFLETLVSSTYVNLPHTVKSFIYLDAFDHLASCLTKLLVDDNPGRISAAAISNFDEDVSYLESFVRRLDAENNNNGDGNKNNNSDTGMVATFLELRQCIEFLKSPAAEEEYSNTQVRMRKYSRLSQARAQKLVELRKPQSGTVQTRPSSPRTSSMRDRLEQRFARYQ